MNDTSAQPSAQSRKLVNTFLREDMVEESVLEEVDRLRSNGRHQRALEVILKERRSR